MELNQFQTEARRFASHPKGTWTVKDHATNNVYPFPMGLVYASLGMGEAGELQGKIKKVIRDSNFQVSPEAKAAIVAELGDVLWYVADVASELGVTLQGVAEANLSKLQSRQDRGVLGGSGDDR